MSAGAATPADIVSADWSLALDTPGAPGSGIGNVVQGLDDVNQCIGIILASPKGCDPLRPDFAIDLWQFIDSPIGLARAAIVREVTAAITKWEPRVTLLAVTADLAIDATAQSGAHLNVSVTWQLKLSGAVPNPPTTVVNITTRLA